MLPPRSSWLPLSLVGILLAAITYFLLSIDKKQMATKNNPTRKPKGEKQVEETVAPATSATTDEPQERETPAVKLISEAPTGKYVVVAGSFKNELHAREYRDKLRESLRFDPEIVNVVLDSVSYYRVVATRNVSAEIARQWKSRIEEAGFDEVWMFRKP